MSDAPVSDAARRGRPVLAATLLAAFAAAQEDNAPIDFRTQDGSRFILLPDDGPPIVHWAIATPAGPLEDPPGLEGLAEACVRASLLGTWRTGSRDADAERQALRALDDAATALATAPRVEGRPPAELSQRHEAAQRAAEALADTEAFTRVLAGLPADRPTVHARPGALVVGLTTTAAALPRVAELLLERREQQPLRRVLPIWSDLRLQLVTAWDASPMAPMRAEVLALAFAGHGLARAAERPGGGFVTLAQAAACWQRTQRPDRTVHVLTGGFVAIDVRAALERTFATTGLPQPPLLVEPAPPRLQASRRSQLPGVRHPMAAIAWQLAGNEDPVALTLASRWFADGPDAWLGQQLRRLGRKQPTVTVQAPWPAAGGPGLLLLEVSEPAGSDHALAEQVLAACATLVTSPPKVGQFQGVLDSLSRAWEADTREPRGMSSRIAAELLTRPDLRLPPRPPAAADARPAPALLARILGSQPVVVAGKAP